MSSEQEGEQALLTLSLIVNVITDGLLCILGYIGNILTIIVLSQDKVYNSNILLMQVLAGYDILLLTHTMLYTVLRSVYPATGWLKQYYDNSPYIVAFVLPFGWIAQTGTIWFTTALAADRYIGITRPFRALTLCTVRNAKRATIVLSVLAFLFNFPRFIYYFNVAANSNNNSTFVAHVRIELPGFDANIYRYIYHISLTFIVLYIIPLTALTVLNFKLISALKAASQTRKRMSMMRNGSPTKQNLTITLNLVIVISKFIICETPDFISSIVGAIPAAANTTEYKMFNTIKEMLLVFNSAVNFYIYCYFNAKFRGNLRRTLPCCPGRGSALERNVSTSTSTLNVSLSSLTLGITAMKGNKRTRDTINTQPQTPDGLDSKSLYRRKRACSECSAGNGAGVSRGRLYSAESCDTDLTGISADMDVAHAMDHLQSDNEDYVIFRHQSTDVYNPENGNSIMYEIPALHHNELENQAPDQCENEDYIIFRFSPQQRSTFNSFSYCDDGYDSHAQYRVYDGAQTIDSSCWLPPDNHDYKTSSLRQCELKKRRLPLEHVQNRMSSTVPRGLHSADADLDTERLVSYPSQSDNPDYLVFKYTADKCFTKDHRHSVNKHCNGDLVMCDDSRQDKNLCTQSSSETLGTDEH